MSLKAKGSSLKSSASAVGRRTKTTPTATHLTPTATRLTPTATRLSSHSRLSTRDLPFVLINMAMTADGKIATANRALSSFGSPRDHEHLLTLRATADAVMSGARTVNLNKINLGPGPEKFRRARLRNGLAEFNLRIIVSGRGALNPHAEIFQHRFEPLPRSRGRGSAAPSCVADDSQVAKSPIIVLTTQRAATAQLKKLRALADEVKVCGKTEINFRAALRWLRAHRGVKRLLCEGGGELNDALFRAGLVDELHLTICPHIFGGRAAPTIAEGRGFAKLANAARLQLKSARRVGAEMFLVFARA